MKDMEDANSKGQCELIRKVMDQGICVACGACVGLCPYFDYFDGRVMAMDECRSETWRCLQICPRADHDATSLNRETGHEGEESQIGPFKNILMARAREDEIRKRAQYGGIVSALLIYAIERGFIKSAILTGRGNELSPAGKIARNKSEILGCAGSRYAASGGLAVLNKAIKQGEQRLAIVGLPCQMEALARMRLMKPDGEERDDRVGLRIGLFCTWALDYRRLNEYLKNIGVKETIEKYDIPPPPSQVFQILTESGRMEFPIDDIRPSIQKGCSLCQDMTSEWADISVGVVEGFEGWNTVVVRSDRGSRVMNEAMKDDILEVDNLPEENFEHLKAASSDKRERGRMNQEEMRRKGS